MSVCVLRALWELQSHVSMLRALWELGSYVSTLRALWEFESHVSLRAHGLSGSCSPPSGHLNTLAAGVMRHFEKRCSTR